MLIWLLFPEKEEFRKRAWAFYNAPSKPDPFLISADELKAKKRKSELDKLKIDYTFYFL